MTRIRSFPPIVSPDARKLILGSMPGKASLAACQYYAHPRNSFWQIISTILDISQHASYEERCHALTRSRLALWDVLKACTRSSSLDADIVHTSIVPNDFGRFLRAHPKITIIFFNGATAERIYLKHVLPRLPKDLAGTRTMRLPSTSPANASIPVAQKLARWQVIAEEVWRG